MNTFKEQCRTLRTQGHTLPEIVRLIGRPKTSVYFHIKDISLPAKKIAEIHKACGERIRPYALARKGKSSRLFKRVDTITPEMALLLGHLLFDGEIRRGACAYSNRSLILIERVVKLMRMLYAYSPRTHLNDATGVMRVTYNNVELAAHLHTQAMCLLETIPSAPQAVKREFLRAFFDDEGCMDVALPKHRRVRGYQKDVRVLEIIQRLLAEFGIESRIVLPNEVVIRGKGNFERFEREINFSQGVCVNGKRSNSRWKESLEKRVLLRRAIDSFKS
ncbi:MAG: hypothetical protein B7X04_02795 [Parcubacteria group bacterium 21-54-25]|nr:MAG: hypothetical protein B7X04_02795 [Parcubacteria group bacterium 21-54-25]HQU07719.1 LAGLIDADG family homing endonuclease [Candidatus Paceibacterota bacterium]